MEIGGGSCLMVWLVLFVLDWWLDVDVVFILTYRNQAGGERLAGWPRSTIRIPCGRWAPRQAKQSVTLWRSRKKILFYLIQRQKGRFGMAIGFFFFVDFVGV